MRIMIFSETLGMDELKKDINFLENNMHMKIDYFNDYEEAEYCIDIRQYDLVYVEYNKKNDRRYYNFLGYINKKELTPKVIVMLEDKNQKDSILEELIKRYNYIEKENIKEINIKKHILNLNPTEETYLIRDNLQINLKDKTIFFKDGEELKEIEFSKKFDFYVLLYFLRHYQSTININSLLDATCTEPEFTKDSIIESSISSIRKSFKEMFNINPIKAFKKVGYRFSIAE